MKTSFMINVVFLINVIVRDNSHTSQNFRVEIGAKREIAKQVPVCQEGFMCRP